ncbi:MAG: hypothetical protein LRY55_10570 [Leadbetterella sp.]|nr:hypothetical protein [Leadbetterella sp.]
MIIKNLTFVVPVRYEDDFLAHAFKATDAVSHWVEDIRAYKIVEQVDPDTFNFAIQLSFSELIRLEAFDSTGSGRADRRDSGRGGRAGFVLRISS